MGNHRLGKNAKEAELNGKEGETKGSFQREITGLQYLAYLSGKKSEEAELNRKEGTTWGSSQQEISSLGVLQPFSVACGIRLNVFWMWRMSKRVRQGPQKLVHATPSSQTV